MVTLRPHQTEAKQEINKAWFVDRHQNVLSVLPTGAGKTILKAAVAAEELQRGGCIVLFAHRDVLLGQISNALCLFGLEHSFVTSDKTRREICDEHVINFGRTYRNDTARVILASVDTFYRRELGVLKEMITLWMMDETHHLLDSSKWHKCIDPLINARGLGVTATPIRADKKGLGREWEGVFDVMCVGATMHQLIEKGMLSPYKVYTPPVKLDVAGLKITASGDFNQKELAKRTDRADITGDAVEHYRRLAWGKQCIVFTVNIAHGEHVAEQYRKAGVSAVNLSSKTPSAERNEKVNAFKRGEIKVLINCDLFGEGFDVPAVECVQMLRKTESYSLFKQQFGRALRVIEGKQFGILIDHVGNVDFIMREYGLQYPHDDPEWTLANTKRKRPTNDVDVRINTRVCPKCFNRYVPTSANAKQCPECEHVETPAETVEAEKAFQAKDGDLVEMSVGFIDTILAKRDEVDRTPEQVKRIMSNAPAVVRNSAVSNHVKRQNAQIVLRDKIQYWCVKRAKEKGINDVEFIQREFELDFGVNILKAQTLSEREANELAARIK